MYAENEFATLTAGQLGGFAPVHSLAFLTHPRMECISPKVPDLHPHRRPPGHPLTPTSCSTFLPTLPSINLPQGKYVTLPFSTPNPHHTATL